MASTGFHCPQCGKGIETNDENGAESMECPYCGKSVPAPSGSPTSKIHCPGCSAKLEIQNDWMGTEITCPKCGKDIMLSEDMILIELKPKPKPVPPPAPLVRNVPPPAAARQEAEAEAGKEMPEEASAPSWSARLLGGYHFLEGILYDKFASGWYGRLFPAAHRGLITAGIICGFAFCLIGVILILCNYDYALTGNYNLFLLSDYGYQLAKWFDKLFSILLYLVFCLGSIYVNVKLIRLSDLLLLSTRGKIAPGILRLVPVFFVFCLLAVVLTLLWFAHSPLFLYALTPLLVLLPVLFVAPVPEVVNVEVAERKIGEVLVDAVAFWLRSVLKFLPLIWIGASFASLCSFSHHGVQPYFLLFLPPLLVINILLNFLVLELLKGILSIPDKLDALKKDAR